MIETMPTIGLLKFALPKRLTLFPMKWKRSKYVE